jgi:hypothetical protein
LRGATTCSAAKLVNAKKQTKAGRRRVKYFISKIEFDYVVVNKSCFIAHGTWHSSSVPDRARKQG